jgi:ABC-type multidrug transport system ATPase subunit
MIETINLTKRYGDLVALDNLNLNDRGGRLLRIHRAQRRG